MSHSYDHRRALDAAGQRRLDVVRSSGVPAVRPVAVARKPDGGAAITLPFILHAARRWWRVALPAGILTAALAAAVVWLLFEPMYLAEVWLQIHETPPFVAFEPQDQESRDKRFVQTQVELIRSPMVLGPVTAQPESARVGGLRSANDPVAWLSGKIQIKSIGESELFRVSFEDADPENSAWLINAVVDQYFRLRELDETRRTQRVIELLDREKKRREEEVGRLRENVRALTKQATGKDPYAANPETIYPRSHPLGNLQEQLILAQVEREVLNARLRAIEEAATQQRGQISAAAVAKAVAEDAQVRKWEAELSEKRIRLNAFQSALVQGKNDEKYRALAREIDRDEQALRQFETELRQRVAADMEVSQSGKRDDEAASLRSQLAIQQIREETLRQRQESELKRLETGSGETLQLQFARSELAQAQQVLDRISTRITQLRTEQRAPARVTLQQRAEAATRPVEARPATRKLVLVCLAGFCFPFALAVVWERIVHRVSDPEQLEQESCLTVVGEIALMPAGVRSAAPAVPSGARETAGLFDESVDSLRTALMLCDDLREMRILTVTSAVSDEGKTSVAVQLAQSLARSGEQLTLLVDGDMRCPDIHRLFGIPLGPGLAEVLSGECLLEEAIVPSGDGCLHLLPAGRLNTSPHRLLSNGARQWLRDNLPGCYRYVIIDSPPLLAASEALVLAKVADACLLCAMRDVSRVGQIKRASERLAAAGAPPAGLVLNGLPPRMYAQRYGKYYSNREPKSVVQ